jgi:hypothetical protein
VQDYIGRPRTLTLVTIGVSLRIVHQTWLKCYDLDDMENRQAMRLAHDADPVGERTIGKFILPSWNFSAFNEDLYYLGILTKPDMLTTAWGAISARKDVLDGRLHPLKHGYYCVRLPVDDERSRNITRAASNPHHRGIKSIATV